MVLCCTKNLSFLPSPLTNPLASSSADPQPHDLYTQYQMLVVVCKHHVVSHLLEFVYVGPLPKIAFSLVFRTTTQSKCQHVLKSFLKSPQQKRPPLNKVYNFIITTVNGNDLFTMPCSIIPAVKGLCLIHLYMTISKV